MYIKTNNASLNNRKAIVTKISKKDWQLKDRCKKPSAEGGGGMTPLISPLEWAKVLVPFERGKLCRRIHDEEANKSKRRLLSSPWTPPGPTARPGEQMVFRIPLPGGRTLDIFGKPRGPAHLGDPEPLPGP